jgi:hypothetical protein
MKLSILGSIAMLVSTTVFAHGDHITEQTLVTTIQYDSSAYNRGIYSYPLIIPSVIAKHDIIYVDSANGQAIYSYHNYSISTSNKM